MSTPIDATGPFGEAEVEPAPHLIDEARPVPTQRAVVVRDRRVLESVQDARFERTRVEIDRGDAAGLRAEIDGEDCRHGLDCRVRASAGVRQFTNEREVRQRR